MSKSVSSHFFAGSLDADRASLLALLALAVAGRATEPPAPCPGVGLCAEDEGAAVVGRMTGVVLLGTRCAPDEDIMGFCSVLQAEIDKFEQWEHACARLQSRHVGSAESRRQRCN